MRELDKELTMGALAALVGILAVVCGVGSIVCWIMVLIKIFKDNVGLGILGIICGLFTFIYGWVKVTEYGIKKVMLWWTVFFLAGILLQVVNMVVLVGMAAAQSQ